MAKTKPAAKVVDDDDIANLNLSFQVADYQEWDAAAKLGIGEILDKDKNRFRREQTTSRFNRNGRLRQHAATHWVNRYQRETGKVGSGDIQSFLEWLLAHKDEIIAFVKAIMALFGI